MADGKGEYMNTETRRRRDVHVAALALAAVPILCMVSLLIINPGYMMSFFDGGTLLGSMVVGVIFLLTLVAYPAFLGSMNLIGSGRTPLGVALMVLTILLCVFPAVFLIIMVPAAIQVMGNVS
jgi:hypothetical protein